MRKKTGNLKNEESEAFEKVILLIYERYILFKQIIHAIVYEDFPEKIL